jgi:serine phosphatase RsbU (regulator of sigma subunit)
MSRRVVDEQRLASVLVEFARTLTSDFSIQRILDHLVDRVVEVIPVDGAGVLLMESDTEHHFVAASDDVILGVETLQMELQEGPCIQAYRTGSHVSVPDLTLDSTFARFSPAAAQVGLGAVYSFPLRLDDRQLGALELYAKEPLELSEADLVGAQILADVTAAYLFNARARDNADELARTSAVLAATLQESLLPPELPLVPGLTLAARWLPGRGGTLVSGDFYDVFPIPAGRWGILIGDAVGHGAQAANLAVVARYTVRTLAVLQAAPHRVLAGLNDTILSREISEQFLSAVYLTTRATAQGLGVRLARGGHPAPLLRHADGTVDVVDSPGAVLGCMPDAGVKDVRLRLTPGDLLLLYSDGVTEARRAGREYTEARLRALLASAGQDPRTVINSVIEAVLEHCDGDLADDVTALALLAT